MNKIITVQDQKGIDFKNLWELKNPKFHQALEGSNEALPHINFAVADRLLAFCATI